MTSSLRVGGVGKSSAGVADGNSPNQSLAGGLAGSQKKLTGTTTTPAGKPARQQELEAQGRHARAKVEGYKGGGDDDGTTGKPNKTTPQNPGHHPHETKISSGKPHGKDKGVDVQPQPRPTAEKPQNENFFPSNSRSENNPAFKSQSESVPPRASRGENFHPHQAENARAASAETPAADGRFEGGKIKGTVTSSDEAPRPFARSEAGGAKEKGRDDASGHSHRFDDNATQHPNGSSRRSETVGVDVEGEGQSYLRLKGDAKTREAGGAKGRHPQAEHEGQSSARFNPETKHSGGRERHQFNVSADLAETEVRAKNAYRLEANEGALDEPESGKNHEHKFLKGYEKPHETHGRSSRPSESNDYFDTRFERNRNYGTHHEKHVERPAQSRASSSREHPTPFVDEVELLTQTRAALRRELRTIGHEGALRFVEPSDELTNRYVEKLIVRAGNSLEEGSDAGRAPEKIARRLAEEVVNAARLSESFARLERVGGETVRRAEEAAMRFLMHDRQPDGRGFAEERLRFAVSAAELLRDLSSGALLQLRDVSNPFPLTGRARVVSEMIELLRTLDAVEKFLGKASAPVRTTINTETLAALFGRTLDAETADEIARMLLQTTPTLPGVAGREEIPRVVAALGGMLTDAGGRPLLTAEGTPLKLHELLWLNTLGGTLTSLHSTERIPTTLSPLLVYGFDALYSLIGFDGRAPAQPRFIVIQSQMNASEFEWVFGQASLSEGWMRAVIERLKDSALTDHNALGEVLEEALTDGRMYSAVMRGTVEAGTPVADSFTLRPAYNFDGPLPAPAV